MKDLLYINYPELTNIKANIVSRKYEDNKTKLLLDRTIFSPYNDYLFNDQGHISALKVIDVYEKNNKIVHLVEGRPNKSQVKLNLNSAIRFHNLYYNTAYTLLKFAMESLYNIKHSKLKLYKSYGQMVISDFFVDFDKNQVEDFINHLIRLNISIENLGLEKNIGSLGQVENPGVSFFTAGEIFGIHIFRYNIIGNGLILEFVTGKDYLTFNKSNLALIESIEKIVTADDLSSNKITKIISAIKSNKYIK